ncbi:MAG: TA system VapC family ribonuclease toxin [Akkermansiaceae bacterium]
MRLLDGNVLAALVLEGHPFHESASDWFVRRKSKFATCAVTQGTLLRLHMRFARDSSAAAAWAALKQIAKHPAHEFWEDGFGYDGLSHRHVQGHRQVTDLWLVNLSKRHRSKVATYDRGMAEAYPSHVELLKS